MQHMQVGLQRKRWPGHIPDFTEKTKRSEKSSTTDVISTLTRTQRKDGMGSKMGQFCLLEAKQQDCWRETTGQTCRTQTELKTSNVGDQRIFEVNPV